MNVASLGFLLLVFAASAPFFYLPERARRWLLAALNATFLVTLVPNGASWAVLGGFLLSGWGVARLLEREPSRALIATYLLVLVASFLILKKYAFLEGILPADLLGHTIGIVGLSYMLFRQIHFLVDTAEGQIPRPSLWVYLNYQLNLFAILSGPIQRFPQFADNWSAPGPLHRDRGALLLAYGRIFWGLLLMMVVGDACLELHHTALAQPTWPRPLRLAAIFYSYPAYVYLNFAGYCGVVIAAASLFGLRLPENFNRPYAARNMLDYWNRWHITLSHWIRDYVFTPSYRVLLTRWPRHSNVIGPICFFVAFLIAGIWHGASTNFVIFGLLNGLGVSIAKTWENLLIWRLGRKGFKGYLAHRGIAVASTALNFHYACITMLFFPVDLGGFHTILGILTPAA